MRSKQCRGRSFEGKHLLDLVKDCDFVMEYSSSYHHSSNGQIERQFRTIKDTIVLKLNEKKTRLGRISAKGRVHDECYL